MRAYQTDRGESFVPMVGFVSHYSEVRRDGTYHPLHETHKTPECNCIILHYSVDRCKKIAHALHISQIVVILVVSE